VGEINKLKELKTHRNDFKQSRGIEQKIINRKILKYNEKIEIS
jgi:hypothetical protein